MPNPYISGTGFFLPPRVVTNDDLSKYMDTTDEWIQERTGIKERCYVDAGVGSSDLAIPATEQALKAADLQVGDIDFIIFATSTPDFYAPGSGCLIQEKMGFNKIGALDIRVQCSGFLYGLSIAEQYIKTGKFKKTRFTMKKGKGFVSAGERGGELRPWAQTTLQGMKTVGFSKGARTKALYGYQRGYKHLKKHKNIYGAGLGGAAAWDIIDDD